MIVKCLLLYYCYLKYLDELGKEWVLFVELSEVVKVDLVIIWCDFLYFGVLGKKGYGYNVFYIFDFFSKIFS